VQAEIAIAGAVPFAPTCFDRLLQPGLGRAIDKVEQGRGAAMKRGAADIGRRRAQQILVAARERDRRQAMDVRVDAARNDDLSGGINDPPRLAKACRGPDRWPASMTSSSVSVRVVAPRKIRIPAMLFQPNCSVHC
jgi:hypothetical protein